MTDLIPAPRPVESPEEPAMTVDRIPLRTVPSFAARLADARACGHTPDQHRHLDGLDADQRDAQRTIRELTAELERVRLGSVEMIGRAHYAEQQLAVATAELARTRRANARLAAELGPARHQLAKYRTELGRALDALAAIRDAHEQTDRALAAYDTTGQEG